MLHARLPDPNPVALAARLGRHDVKAEESEGLAVAHDRDATHRLAIQPADQKACGIGGLEGDGVAQAGIPAFCRRPVRRTYDVGGAHDRNLE